MDPRVLINETWYNLISKKKLGNNCRRSENCFKHFCFPCQ